MDPVLALVTLGILPFHVLVYYLFRKPILAYAREAKERMADVSGDLIEQFDGATTVKASATQLIEQEKLRSSMRKGMRAQIKQNRYYLLQKVSADLLVGVGVIILFGWGGYSVLYRGMSPGEFVAFYGYVWLLYPRVITLVGLAGKFSKASTSVERVFEMLSIEPGVKDDPKAVPFEIGRGRIEFRNVSFGYQNGKVLEDVSFAVEGGEHVLITGPSGAGKSTCVNLIPRFYDPRKGSILIDGVDVRDFTLTSLRRQIGFVFQDCFLFNDTIMANIRYAWPQAGDDGVIEAARKAYADEFIEKLPEGYMTMIGEGGVQLSQGEKRRLMIARAILKNPRILILDEPLVSLDEGARKRAVEGLASLISNRTVLTITHYPAELPFAVKRVHVSDGRVTVRDLSGEETP
jgi:ABC-type multidrug transport system fused ATPase/permease subunit